MLVSIDGDSVDPSQACLPLASQAVVNGFAVFESMRTYHGQVFRMEDHLDRLFRSAEGIGMVLSHEKNTILDFVATLLNEVPSGESRIRVTLADDHVFLMITPLAEKPHSFYEQGIELIHVEGERTLPHIKKLGDLMTFLTHQQAQKQGAYDAVLVTQQGLVRECSYANLFWVKEGVLYTCGQNVLKGITRQTVMELDGNCQFANIFLEDFLQVDEVFITQTSSGILPVIKIDGQLITKGQPGPKTQKLMQAFRKRVWG